MSTSEYTKGLRHDPAGGVVPDVYRHYQRAIASGIQQDFEDIPWTPGGAPLINPLAGLASDLNDLTIPSPPPVGSAQRAAEAVELYWMALLRDVPFAGYSSSTLASDAARELTGLPGYRGTTAGSLFRGPTDGDKIGPYISQFLYQSIPYGPYEIQQKILTVLPIGKGGSDYLTDLASFQDCQNGIGPNAAAWKTPAAPPNRMDPTRRYIRTGRDLGQYVHVDAAYQAYLDAALYLLSVGAARKPGLPYAGAKTQAGFTTFGGPHILSMVAAVTQPALMAAWYQKWFVHRDPRPEEYGGLVHRAKRGWAVDTTPDRSVLDSQAVAGTFLNYDSYLLPQAFPEGCPQHPSYPQGHGTVAGAGVTILKAFFDESWTLPDAKVPTSDGQCLVDYSGVPLTVGHELDKLASNIALGRNHAGVHWRSDYWQGLLLGERVAVSILRDQIPTLHEDLPSSWTFTGFEGAPIDLMA